jgi:hypothetical protein
MRIALILLVAAGLIYAIAAGLGLTHMRKHGLIKKTVMLDDFEDADNDFDWFTGGYAKLEQSNQNQTHGKHSAKVTFYTRDQFETVPTPPPGITPTPEPTWQPQIVLDTHSVTHLTVFDWTDFTSLKLDAFNPMDQPVTYHLKVSDSKTFSHDTSGVMLGKKVTNISVLLDDLAQDRMDITNMNSIQFWVDMDGASQPMSVYIDNLRLEFDPGEVKKK